MIRWNPTVCPTCDRILPGLGTYCEDCGAYTEDMVGATADVPPERRDTTDTRSEDERKRDALPAVTAMGWIVVDLEQGFRPFTCRHCGGAIAGGTRVPLGTPDWLVMGHGCATWLEWKSGTGRQTAQQRSFAADCAVAGVPYYVVRTTEEAVRALTDARARYAA